MVISLISYLTVIISSIIIIIIIIISSSIKYHHHSYQCYYCYRPVLRDVASGGLEEEDRPALAVEALLAAHVRMYIYIYIYI